MTTVPDVPLAPATAVNVPLADAAPGGPQGPPGPTGPQGPAGPQGPGAYPPTTGELGDVLTVTTDGGPPTWQPTAPTGADLEYLGAYNPATVYNDGDYVIGSDGGTYVCVVDGTVGIPPSATGWAAGDLLTYRGDYSGATVYNDGDIVVGTDGFPYVCVLDNVSTAPVPFPGANGGIPLPVQNGKWIKGVGGAAVWADISFAYGTSLPASPYDGQEAVLVDSVTNPTYQWRFRYNAGSSSAYKWEFVGGAPMFVEDGTTSASITSTTYVALGPGLNVPRAGDYDIRFDVSIATTVGGAAGYCTVKRGSVSAQDSEAVYHYNPGSTNATEISLSRARRFTAMAASENLTLQARVTSNSAQYRFRTLSVWPVRVA